MIFARIACYMAIGAVMASGGITWRNWQSYVVLVLIAVACLLSELITARKCP
jgi:hypothetical protein